jgi:hypothetical protein
MQRTTVSGCCPTCSRHFGPSRLQNSWVCALFAYSSENDSRQWLNIKHIKSISDVSLFRDEQIQTCFNQTQCTRHHTGDVAIRQRTTIQKKSNCQLTQEILSSENEKQHRKKVKFSVQCGVRAHHRHHGHHHAVLGHEKVGPIHEILKSSTHRSRNPCLTGSGAPQKP